MSSPEKGKEKLTVKSKCGRRPETGMWSGVRSRSHPSSKRGSGDMRRMLGCTSGMKCINCGADASTEYGCGSQAKSKDGAAYGKRKRVCSSDDDVLEDEVVLVGAAGRIKDMLDKRFVEHTTLLHNHAEDIKANFNKKMRSVEKSLKKLTHQWQRYVSCKFMLMEPCRELGESDEESDEMESSLPYEGHEDSSERSSGGSGNSISDGTPSPTVVGLSSASEEGHILGEDQDQMFEEAVVVNQKLVQKFVRSRGKNVVAFKLRNPASEEQFRIALYLFPRNLLSDQMVVRFGKTELIQEDLWSLGPGECLNGTVISAYAHLLTMECHERERECRGTWFLPTRVSIAELGKIDCLQNAMSMSLLDRFYGVFSSCDRIIAHVHDKMNNHWFLALILLGTNNVEVWDSLTMAKSRAQRNKLVVALLSTLDRLFKTFICQQFGPHWSFTKLGVVHRKDLPKQEGGVECGVFVMHFMRCLSDRLDVHSQFSVDETRLGIGMQLFTCKFNELRDPLTIEASTLYVKCKDACSVGKEVASGHRRSGCLRAIEGRSFGAQDPVSNPVVAKAKKRKVKGKRSWWTRVWRPRR